jgi:hypothetical protein
MGYPRGRTSSLLANMEKLVSDYTISYPQRFIILTWIIGFPVKVSGFGNPA